MNRRAFRGRRHWHVKPDNHEACLSLLAAVGGISAQGALCLGPSDGSTSEHYWYFNIEVTHARGIALRPIQQPMASSVIGSTTDCELYVCNAGEATVANVSDPSAWTLHGTAMHNGSVTNGPNYYRFDYDALYLKPGTHGIALHRTVAGNTGSNYANVIGNEEGASLLFHAAGTSYPPFPAACPPIRRARPSRRTSGCAREATRRARRSR